MSITNNNKLCEYCHNRIACYTLKNGKQCCESSWQSCPKKRKEQQVIMKEIMNRPESKERIRKLRKGAKDSNETKEKKRIALLGNQRKKGKKESKKTKHKKSISHKRTIKYIKIKYSFFYKEEELRYDPTALKNNQKIIQVHCKNHNCSNSKEQDGWFTPTGRQIESRIWAIENKNGNGGCYFYCSEKCKHECSLYYSRGTDPFENKKLIYTYEEYQIFRRYVLKRDNYECQYCGKKAEHVHHERPQKLEPFFSLDPDLAWSVCKKCHYKYGHKDECSTGNLAKIICNQKKLKVNK